MTDIGKLCAPVSCCCKHYFQQKNSLGRKFFNHQKKISPLLFPPKKIEHSFLIYVVSACFDIRVSISA